MPESTPAARHRISLCLLLMVVALYVLDQVSKWYIVLNFELPHLRDMVNVFTTEQVVFNIVRVHNNGVAFGFGSGTVWAPYVFLGIQVLALVWLVWLFRRGLFCTRLLKLAWGFIMVGVLGNMTDRLLQGFFLPGADQLSFGQNLANGYVVDFLDFSFPWLMADKFWGGYHWPSFNVADSCVCIAATLFVIASFLTPDPAKEEKAASAKEESPEAPAGES